jgi:hypothetical protein
MVPVSTIEAYGAPKMLHCQQNNHRRRVPGTLICYQPRKERCMYLPSRWWSELLYEWRTDRANQPHLASFSAMHILHRHRLPHQKYQLRDH